MMRIDWNTLNVYIEGKKSEEKTNVTYVAKVPGGWLYSENDCTPIFLSDPEHEWFKSDKIKEGVNDPDFKEQLLKDNMFILPRYIIKRINKELNIEVNDVFNKCLTILKTIEIAKSNGLIDHLTNAVENELIKSKDILKEKIFIE